MSWTLSVPCCDVISTRGFVAGAPTGEGTVIAFELDVILSVRPPKRPLAVKLWTRNGCRYWLFQYRAGGRPPMLAQLYRQYERVQSRTVDLFMRGSWRSFLGSGLGMIVEIVSV